MNAAARQGKAFLGDDAEFDHVGIAVPYIDAALADTDIVRDDLQRVSVAFANIYGIRVEFIEPLGTTSPIAKNLTANQRLVHLCFRVPDVRKAIDRARANGLFCIADPCPAPAFDGRRIAWLYDRTFGLIEIVEAVKAREGESG